MTKEEAKQGLMTRTSGFITDCKEELRKVSHPTKQETTRATLVTLFMVTFVAATLALFDLVFHQLMMVLLQGGKAL